MTVFNALGILILAGFGVWIWAFISYRRGTLRGRRLRRLMWSMSGAVIVIIIALIMMLPAPR